MQIWKSFSKAQKESIGLLQIGTFLEYFDLMLFVHMGVLFNELFFPSADHHTASIFSAIAFCSTFIFRPFGALFFGWIGDNLGRKVTVFFTMLIMSVSCIVMANLKTYAEIGITAAWVVTICRIAQGMSSMGEVIGAELYITETVKPPLQYPAVALVTVSAMIGSVVALVSASLFTSHGFNWRSAFWLGASIALVGSVARFFLRETPEFIDMQRRIKAAKKKEQVRIFAEIQKKEDEEGLHTPAQDRKSGLMLFFVHCAIPVTFYFSYIYCGGILKTTFSFTAEAVIHQNLMVTIVQLLAMCFVMYLSYWIHPLMILKVKLFFFAGFMLICPYWLQHISSPIEIFLIQAISVFLAPDTTPASPVFFSHFPILKRFTYASFPYALSRAIMYPVISFGLIYAVEWIGNWGLWVVFIPTMWAFFVGIKHFEELERGVGKYPLETSKNLKQAA